MLNPEAKLNPKIFDENVAERPTRDGFGEGLVLAGDANKDVVALCADLIESTRVEAFAKKYPARYFELGVAEQNMATIAAGLGISGKIPFIASYATFSPGRNWEQIRTTIAYNDSNVKIAGHHAGISVGPGRRNASGDGGYRDHAHDAEHAGVDSVRCDRGEKSDVCRRARMGSDLYQASARETPVMTTEETPYSLIRHRYFGNQRRLTFSSSAAAVCCITRCLPRGNSKKKK